MKRHLIRLCSAVLLLVATTMSPAMVSAATDPFEQACRGGGAGSAVCSNNSSGDPIAGPNGVIVNITSILALIAGIVSVSFMVWGGIKYITSGGDSSGVSTAKNTIIAALVGLLVALLARPIVVFIVSRL